MDEIIYPFPDFPSLGLDKEFHLTHNRVYDYLSMLGFKIILVNKIWARGRDQLRPGLKCLTKAISIIDEGFVLSLSLLWVLKSF